MKKHLVWILFLITELSCVLLSACGAGEKKDLSDSRYVGTWEAVSMSLKGETAPFESECRLVLHADGTAEFSSEEEVSKCTWSETSDGFKLRGDAKMTFSDDGDGIKSVVLGAELHFTKTS